MMSLRISTLLSRRVCQEYLFLKELLHDEEKLADYLDYLHMQKVKEKTGARFSLEDVKRQLALD